jgi:hypothetical protein
MNRANKLTCGNKCRQAAHRQRRQRAQELQEAGKTIKQIASELGSNVESVKRWLQKRKEK